jgi:restriction system protein
MAIGDWIVLPRKLNRTIHFGKITGEYKYNSNLENPYFHYRDVEWFSLDVPRDRFEQDILYSMGAFMTVCKRHKKMLRNALKRCIRITGK